MPAFPESSPSMPVVAVTKRALFSAAHHYWLPEWSEAENRWTFHACSNRFGHGHNYALSITVEGPVDPETAMVVNLNVLKRVLREEIVERLDHTHLNHQVPFFRTHVPTLENLCLYCWHRLLPCLEPLGLRLTRLRLVENETLWAEYLGGPVPWLDPTAITGEPATLEHPHAVPVP